MPVQAISLRKVSGAPEHVSLKDGEWAIDEAAQRIYMRLLDDVAYIPLGGQGFPQPTGETSDVLLQGKAGLTYAPLVAGTGGQPLDGRRWCIPGAAPRAYVTTTVTAAGLLSDIDIAKPMTLEEIRINIVSGTGLVTITLTDEAGVEAFTRTVVAAPGPVQAGFNPTLELAAGYYTVSVIPSGTIEVSALLAAARHRAEAPHAVFFEVK